jgi:hypothetical protein
VSNGLRLIPNYAVPLGCALVHPDDLRALKEHMDAAGESADRMEDAAGESADRMEPVKQEREKDSG